MNYLNTYLYFSVILMAVGIYGLLSKRNWAKILISLEIIVLSAMVLLGILLFSSSYLGIVVGQTFIVLLVFLDSSITGILLACIMLIYRKFKVKSPDEMSKLKG
ncbi:MAG: hypothetical protein DRN04_06745 [Thermoprotei archaeon]|nr:MAG: hypothetical protein DRN04_06745 [Thermoprotei archaeon]